MMNDANTHPQAAEATDSKTDPERLAQLSSDEALKPLIAANPATPEAVLRELAHTGVVAVRRALTKNPNTPVDLLLRLLEEFPREFLANPVLPLLNLTQATFIKNASLRAWFQLLRCEQTPPLWLKWLKQGDVRIAKLPAYKQILPVLAAHVAIAEETGGKWEKHIASIIEANKTSPQWVDPIPFFMTLALTFALPQVMLADAKAHGYLDSYEWRFMIKHNPAISAGWLRKLASDENIAKRRAVACHPLTPEDVLLKLAIDVPQVRCAVANNPHVSPSLLHQLAKDSDGEVRRAVALNNRLGVKDISRLANDGEPSVRAAVALRYQLGAFRFEQFVSDDDALVRAAVGRNVRAPREILTALAGDPDVSVRAAVARNPCLPGELYEILLDDAEEAVRAGLAGNPQLSEMCFQQLVRGQSLTVRRALAANKRLPLPLFRQLMNICDMAIWKGLAGHPRATPDILTRLAHEGDVMVCAAVAANKRTPVEILRLLAARKEMPILKKLASNPHTPLDILKALLVHEDGQLWIRIAYHPTVVREHHQMFLELFLEYLFKDEGNLTRLRKLLITLPETPEVVLDVFAQSWRWEERYLVATRPGVSRHLLDELVHDGNRYVRAAARAALEKL